MDIQGIDEINAWVMEFAVDPAFYYEDTNDIEDEIDLAYVRGLAFQRYVEDDPFRPIDVIKVLRSRLEWSLSWGLANRVIQDSDYKSQALAGVMLAMQAADQIEQMAKSYDVEVIDSGGLLF